MDLEVSDIGTKALPEATSVKLRDVMNGYAQVKARDILSSIYHDMFSPRTKTVLNDLAGLWWLK